MRTETTVGEIETKGQWMRNGRENSMNDLRKEELDNNQFNAYT